jgi:hypothetical protein
MGLAKSQGGGDARGNDQTDVDGVGDLLEDAGGLRLAVRREGDFSPAWKRLVVLRIFARERPCWRFGLGWALGDDEDEDEEDRFYAEEGTNGGMLLEEIFAAMGFLARAGEFVAPMNDCE